MAMSFSGQWYMDKNNRGGVEVSSPRNQAKKTLARMAHASTIELD